VQVSISARHGHLASTTQEKIAAKVEKLQRYHERTTAIVVTVDLEHRENPKVEIKVTAEHSTDCVATDSGPNVLAALDGALHKVEGQLRKHRDRENDHRKANSGREGGLSVEGDE